MFNCGFLLSCLGLPLTYSICGIGSSHINDIVYITNRQIKHYRMSLHGIYSTTDTHAYRNFLKGGSRAPLGSAPGYILVFTEVTLRIGWSLITSASWLHQCCLLIYAIKCPCLHYNVWSKTGDNQEHIFWFILYCILLQRVWCKVEDKKNLWTDRIL